jgi:hypothetical protein
MTMSSPLGTGRYLSARELRAKSIGDKKSGGVPVTAEEEAFEAEVLAERDAHEATKTEPTPVVNKHPAEDQIWHRIAGAEFTPAQAARIVQLVHSKTRLKPSAEELQAELDTTREALHKMELVFGPLYYAGVAWRDLPESTDEGAATNALVGAIQDAGEYFADKG